MDLVGEIDYKFGNELLIYIRNKKLIILTDFETNNPFQGI